MISLRDFGSEHAGRLKTYLNNPEVMKFLTTRIPQPYKNEDAIWWINEGSKSGIVKAIHYQDVFVGAVGAERLQFERQHSAEVGYWLGQRYWGRGIATNALREFCSFVFTTTDIIRLQAHVYEGNIASERVLQKVGFRLEGQLEKAIFKDGVLMDARLYALVRL